jgi:hypothetical protein
VNCIVIRVGVQREESGLERLVVSLDQPPLGPGDFRHLPCAPTDPEFTLAADRDEAETVRTAGNRLYAGLAGGHPDIGQALTQATGAQPGDRRPLYVQLRAGAEAEQIPWETICLPDGTFLGLDDRWSVARTVISQVPQSGIRAFEPPLRVAALLSCFGIPAEQEWAELAAAVERSPVPVKLLVFAGEPQLQDTVADSPLDVEVAGLPDPGYVDQLKRKIASFRPHVLHFFCHGSTDQGAHLELATTADWDRGRPDTSLFLEAAAIGDFSDPVDRSWLAVLNCCEGAASHEQLYSLARDLIVEAGFPAVVGMREPILSDDATSFSRAFYPALFAAVADRAAAGAGPLDWSALLVDPRRNLVQRRGGVFGASAAKRREWTLPVLYLRTDDFVLAPPSPERPTGHDLLLLEILRTMRSAAPPDAPADYRAELDAKIAEIERGGE